MLSAPIFEHSLLKQFLTDGSTMQIGTVGSMFALNSDRYLYEGEVAALAVEGTTLIGSFKWLAEKDFVRNCWRRVQDPTKLSFSISLELYESVSSPDEGRLVFLPREPIHHEQILLLCGTYSGSTGRKPLSLSEVDS